jgi:hypothetical protein
MQDLLPIIAAAIIYFVVGFIWYSPKVFGKKWMDLSGVKCEEGCKGMYCSFLGAFILAIVIAAVLNHFVHTEPALTALEGAKVGLIAWLGFGATLPFSAVLWEKRPLSLYFIYAGCLLVSLVLMGALLAVWH